MTENFLIIGSNSFSGAHFINCALEADAKVVGISRSPELHPVFLPYKQNKHRNFTFKQLDLNHDLDGIIKAVREFKPAYIINFAAQGMVAESWQNPTEWFMTNTVSAIKLHDKLRKFDFIRKFVQVSTPEVYGNCQGRVRENTDYQPSTPYAVSKAAADMSLMAFHKAYGFPVVFTRAANVYGPCQQLYRIIPRTILYFLTGKKLQLHGGGTSIRSFIHIRDVADGTLRVARQAKPGEIFHFATENHVSIRKLVEMIAEQLGIDFETHVEVVGDRLGKDSAYQLDCTKAGRELGWKDQISLEQGLEETISWVRDNLPTLNGQPLNYIHEP